MMRVGFVGWRGMVGSVLHAADAGGERLRSHRAGLLLDVERGRRGARARQAPPAPLRDAHAPSAFASSTPSSPARAATGRSAMHPAAARGRIRRLLDRRRVDAAHARRRRHHPRSRQSRRHRRARSPTARANFIGGNCTVSLMVMALAGLLGRGPGRVDDVHDLPGGVRRGRAEHARAPAADGRGAPRGEGAARRSGIVDPRHRPRSGRHPARRALSRPSTPACRSPAASFRGSTRTWATA